MLAREFRLHLAALGLSSSEFARKAGYKPTSVRRWMSGAWEIPDHVIDALEWIQ